MYIRGFIIASAAVTCFLSLLVVLTPVLFKPMRNRLFMKLVAYISLCDFLANLATFFQMGSSCVLHGLWYYFFFGASYNWTALFAVVLYQIATNQKIKLRLHTLHGIAWGLASLRAFLPLTTTNYGTVGQWCEFKKRNGESGVWVEVWMAIDALVWIGAVFVIILILRIRLSYLLYTKALPSSPTVDIAKEAMNYYPFALIVCWSLRFVMDVATLTTSDMEKNEVLQVFAQVVYSLHGAVMSVIFFLNSKEARSRWLTLAIQLRHQIFGKKQEETNRLTDSFENGKDDYELDADVQILEDGEIDNFLIVKENKSNRDHISSFRFTVDYPNFELKTISK